MFSLNKPGLLGIDIGDDAVRVVELGAAARCLATLA